jgi:menaquinone-specific isochorismate synthase
MTGFLQTGFILREGTCLWVSQLFTGLLTPLETQEISVVCADFFDSNKGVSFRDVKAHQISLQDFTGLLQDFLGTGEAAQALPKRSWTSANRQNFHSSFASVQDLIQKGELKKAVPLVFEESVGAITPEEKGIYLLRALSAPTHLNVFGAWDADQGVLGATPEILFRRQGQVFESMALAGTLPKSMGTSKMSLLQDLKEVNEHSFVVEDIEKKLKQLGPVGVQGPQVIELPHLFHLQTQMQVLLQSVKKGEEYVRLLHPTPALGIFPGEAGLDWFRTLPEQETRGMFGGPALFDFKDFSLALVMIRSLFWNSAKLRMGAGCGIIAESQEEKEWEEIQQKLLSIKKIFGIS